MKQSKLESIFWPCFKVCLGGPGRGNEGGCKKELPKDEVQLGGINQAGHRVNKRKKLTVGQRASWKRLECEHR